MVSLKFKPAPAVDRPFGPRLIQAVRFVGKRQESVVKRETFL